VVGTLNLSKPREREDGRVDRSSREGAIFAWLSCLKALERCYGGQSKYLMPPQEHTKLPLLPTKNRPTTSPPFFYFSTGLSTSPESAVGTLRTRIYQREKTEVSGGRGASERNRNETDGVGASSSRAPSLNRDDRVSLLQHTELESTRKSVADTVVDLGEERKGVGSGFPDKKKEKTYIGLPSLVRAGLGLLVEHRVASTVEMDLSRRLGIPRNWRANEDNQHP
jgi:hypothetical protein